MGHKSNEFGVKFVKNMLAKNQSKVDIFKFSWCKWLPAKCNIFAWRAGLGSIATVDALKRRNINIQDTKCCVCNKEEESIDHLFTGCLVARIMWQAISRWCRTQQIFAFSFRDLLEVNNHLGLKEPEKSSVCGIIIIGCWSIWRSRKEARFANKTVKMDKIISEVKSVGFLWARNRSKCKDLSWENWCKFVIM
ncbi:putative reverse transcriptase zinc-binding domain-containing protein [Helianthus annuus]|uniref:Reverse transcriptase zinc-binding domain-containing protein n=1 Tax=Helianthus annuus TaxID=4232 RepID=A0A9K3N183_HELAN|nr:putative reverse transcriptase zinc-binding domain-containing protein [Helianthus annuus]KAJ0876395.1 putative reverse transcriptase zinc-binding domain-containing protein [Helianthus annuus]